MEESLIIRGVDEDINIEFLFIFSKEEALDFFNGLNKEHLFIGDKRINIISNNIFIREEAGGGRAVLNKIDVIRQLNLYLNT